MARKNAKGGGTIRQRKDGRWEARFTVGRDPGTGKQIQRSVYGSTQKEVRQKLAQAVAAIDSGTYTAPSRLTVGQWLDIWQKDYWGNLKPATVQAYEAAIRKHIKPALGAVRLTELHPHMVQGFINGMEGYSPTTVRMSYRVLHNALEKAVDLDYIPRNPSDRCELPRQDREEVHPLDDQQLATLLLAVKGHKLEHLITVALFTGMRMSELLGLTWNDIDTTTGAINVNKQLLRTEFREKHGLFASPKSGKGRTITAAPQVMRTFQAQRSRQAEMQLKAGPLWDNPHGLIFTNRRGGPMEHRFIDRQFKQLVDSVGLSGFRFHDCRHTFAVNSLRAGDDVKTVQGNLGHATAEFMLDRYAHFTEQMQKASAARMEGFIKDVLNL